MRPKKFNIDEEEQKLLNEGSAIKLICIVYGIWGQQGYPSAKSRTIDKIQELIVGKRVDHLPELKAVLNLSIENIQKGTLEYEYIYKKYVIGYFKSLIKD